MPISDFRSSASSTKIRKISSTPAAIENSPISRNSDVNSDPNRSALSTLSCLNGVDSKMWRSRASAYTR